jgi:hypothetical protein
VTVDLGTTLDILDACVSSQAADETPRTGTNEPGKLLRLALSNIDLTPEDLRPEVWPSSAVPGISQR